MFSKGGVAECWAACHKVELHPSHTHERRGRGNERRDEEHCHFQCDMFCIVLQQFLCFLHAQKYPVKKRAKGRFEMKIG